MSTEPRTSHPIYIRPAPVAPSTRGQKMPQRIAFDHQELGSEFTAGLRGCTEKHIHMHTLLHRYTQSHMHTDTHTCTLHSTHLYKDTLTYTHASCTHAREPCLFPFHHAHHLGPLLYMPPTSPMPGFCSFQQHLGSSSAPCGFLELFGSTWEALPGTRKRGSGCRRC